LSELGRQGREVGRETRHCSSSRCREWMARLSYAFWRAFSIAGWMLRQPVY